MPTDPYFEMVVEDVFSIRGRGTVAVGKVTQGTLHSGDEIFIRRQGSSRKATVAGLEMFRKVMDQAGAGDNVGVLLKDVDRNDIARGDLLAGS